MYPHYKLLQKSHIFDYNLNPFQLFFVIRVFPMVLISYYLHVPYHSCMMENFSSYENQRQYMHAYYLKQKRNMYWDPHLSYSLLNDELLAPSHFFFELYFPLRCTQLTEYEKDNYLFLDICKLYQIYRQQHVSLVINPH